MLNVYLLRHGETTWNAEGNRYCGRTNVPLTERGIAQAMEAGRRLRDIRLDAVYCSPLDRALHTARIAAGGESASALPGSRSPIADERLIEADFGQWEGKTREQFVAENPAFWEAWDADPATGRAGGSGETGMQVVLRVDDFFREAVRRHAQPSGTILVVAHNGVNRLYLAWKLGMPLRNYRRLHQENASVTLFTLDDAGELTLRLLNAGIPADSP
ncbi:MAG TPA: histidine phosphatase family protein [Puia sp.]|nr:histidine phosphatase family protein [Puia sp.]